VQAVCYRKEIGIESNPSIGKSEDELAPLSPGLFYPECGQEEMAMWTHWLPTSHTFIAAATYAIWGALQKWEAPVEVMDEFKWALNLQMFEEYAIRTPVRRDARDPLLLARLKDVWYRIALWGKASCSLLKRYPRSYGKVLWSNRALRNGRSELLYGEPDSPF